MRRWTTWIVVAAVLVACGEDQPPPRPRQPAVTVRPGSPSVEAMAQAQKQQSEFYAAQQKPLEGTGGVPLSKRRAVGCGE